MRSHALAALVACLLAGCTRDAGPAVDIDPADTAVAAADASDATPPSAVPATPAVDAAALATDAADTMPPVEPPATPTAPGGDAIDAIDAGDPLRCARMVIDGPRAAGCDALPAEVLAFLDRRASCEHWRGEPYAEPAELAAADPQGRAALEARRDEIVRNANDECRGTDATLAALRRRHASDLALRGLLAAFEDRIEY